jgi:hypothetical protein
VSEVQGLPIRISNGAEIIARAGVAEDFLIDAAQSITASIRGLEPGDRLLVGNWSSELGIAFENPDLGDQKALLLAGSASIELLELASDLFSDEQTFEALLGANAVTYVI